MMKTLYGNLVTRNTYIKMLKWYLNNPEPSAPSDPYGNYDPNSHYGKHTLDTVHKLLKQAQQDNNTFAFRTSDPFQLGFDTEGNPLNTKSYVNDMQKEIIIQPKQIKSWIEQINKDSLNKANILSQKLDKLIPKYKEQRKQQIKNNLNKAIKPFKESIRNIKKSIRLRIFTKKEQRARMIKRQRVYIMINRNDAKQELANLNDRYIKLSAMNDNLSLDNKLANKMTKLGTTLYNLPFVNLAHNQNKKAISKPCFKSDLTKENVFGRWNNQYGNRNNEDKMLYITDPTRMIDYKLVHKYL